MKKLISMLLLSSLVSFASEIYEVPLKDIKGEKFSIPKNKVVLIVNTATKCGFTSQFEDLEKLYKDYASKGLVVIGIPSNDFGGQNPESNKETAEFCRLTYGVSFPMLERTVVKGDKKHPLFQLLTKEDGEISWNFEKFLLNKEGQLVERYSSITSPTNRKLIAKIKELLRPGL
jgi:glutathione peroxidase